MSRADIRNITSQYLFFNWPHEVPLNLRPNVPNTVVTTKTEPQPTKSISLAEAAAQVSEGSAFMIEVGGGGSGGAGTSSRLLVTLAPLRSIVSFVDGSSRRKCAQQVGSCRDATAQRVVDQRHIGTADEQRQAYGFVRTQPKCEASSQRRRVILSEAVVNTTESFFWFLFQSEFFYRPAFGSYKRRPPAVHLALLQ